MQIAKGRHDSVISPHPANDLSKFIVNRYLLGLASLGRARLGPAGWASSRLESGHYLVHRCALPAWLAKCSIGAKRCRCIAAPADPSLDVLNFPSLVDVFTNLLFKLPANFGFAGGLFHVSG